MAPRKPKPGRRGDDDDDDYAASEARTFHAARTFVPSQIMHALAVWQGVSPKSRGAVSADEDEDLDPTRSKLIDVLDRLHSSRTQIRLAPRPFLAS